MSKEQRNLAQLLGKREESALKLVKALDRQQGPVLEAARSRAMPANKQLENLVALSEKHIRSRARGR